MAERPENTPEITIDRMSLRLPRGYGPRAANLSRAIADELARMPLAADARLEHIAVPTISLAGGETDAAIGRRIAAAIHTQIHAAPGAPNGGGARHA